MSHSKSFLWFLAGCNKYILCILTIYSTSWLPWILTFLTDTALVHTGFHHSVTVTICGQFSVSERDIIHQQLQNGTGDPPPQTTLEYSQWPPLPFPGAPQAARPWPCAMRRKRWPWPPGLWWPLGPPALSWIRSSTRSGTHCSRNRYIIEGAKKLLACHFFCTGLANGLQGKGLNEAGQELLLGVNMPPKRLM